MELPPRWLKCPRRSELIADKFIAFKTPLDERYLSKIPPADYFMPSMLIQSAHSLLNPLKLKLALWIDLTNTSRFYDKTKHVESKGIKYVKIQCRGHGATPDLEQTRTFIAICKNFFDRNPDGVIGVHCTHGFNRTGFLISSFLVEAEDWSVDTAIQTFATKRPPGIYKADYLAELFRRYDPDESPPPAPVMPSWCFESDGDARLDDDGNVIENGSSGPAGGESKFMEGVSGVTPVTEVRKAMALQEKIRKMCALLGWTRSKGFPGSQPVSMGMENIGLLEQCLYRVSWKADGTRYLMLIDGGRDEVYFFDRDNRVFQASGVTFPMSRDLNAFLFETLVDGEMVLDEFEGRTTPRFLIYDIISYKGRNVGAANFDTRLLCITNEIIDPRERAKRHGLIDRTREPFGVRMKDFWDITRTKETLVKFSQGVHEIDGLIFQPVPDPYRPDRCDRVLKWKPPSLNSVDFRLKIIKESGQGLLPKRHMCLFVGQLDPPFDEIPFKKDLIQYDGKIIECKYDMQAKHWVFMRERTDKSFPNAHSTAMAVCNSIKHPISRELLLDFIEKRAMKPRPAQHPSHPQGHPQNPNAPPPPHQHPHAQQPPRGPGDAGNDERKLMPPPPPFSSSTGSVNGKRKSPEE